ncbi:MAG: YncE family protein [Candidatus Fermentibacteraceae bacterium]
MLRPAVAAGLLLVPALHAADYPDSVVATVSLGGASGPVGVCASPDGGHVYAAAEFGIVSSVETDGYSVDGTCYIGSELGGICVTPDGQHLLACNVEESSVEVIGAGDMQHLATVEVGADPEYIEAVPDGQRVLVTCNLFQLWVIETGSWTVEEVVSVGSSPRGVCALPGSGSACVARSDSYNATLVDLDDYGTADLFTGADTRDVCASPDGSLLYFTVPPWDMVKVVDVGTGQVVDEVSGVGDEPLDICVLPGGQHLYVSSSGTGEVMVLDLSQGTVADTVSTGASPLGICVHPAGTEVYVVDNELGELAVIGGGPSGVESGDDAGGVQLSLAGTNPCTGTAGLELSLSEPAAVTVRLFDIAGRQLMCRRMGQLPAGCHAIDLTVPASGVFVCSAEAEGDTAFLRLTGLGR